MESKDFPQYRRLPNGKNYYKVVNENHLVEYKIWGSYWEMIEHKARVLPDQVWINDVFMCRGAIEKISKKTFEETLAEIKRTHKKLSL